MELSVRFISLVIVLLLCSGGILAFIYYLIKQTETKAAQAKKERDEYAARLLAELEERRAAQGHDISGGKDSAPVAGS